MRVIVVGGSASGASFATRLKRLDSTIEVILIEKGPDISYATCGLPYYISGDVESIDDLILSNPKKMKEKYNIDARVNTEVVGINTNDKEIKIVEGGSGTMYTLSYDKIVLAMGCAAKKLEAFKFVGDNVFILKNILNGKRLKSYLENNNVETALVIGSGATGIEIAESLVKRNIRVTLVDESSNILRQYDNEISEKVEEDLRDKMDIVLNTKVTHVEDGKPFVIHLNNIKKIFDIAVVSAGVIPYTNFLEDSEVKLSNSGYVFVNDRFETTAEDVYAIGDIAIVKAKNVEEYILPKLASNAHLQARICADNVLGRTNRYTGALATSILKIFDKTLAKTGINENQALENELEYVKVELTGKDKAPYYPGATDVYIKAVFESGTLRILGAEIYGGDGVDKRIDVIATAITAGFTAYDLNELELAYSPPYSTPRDLINILGSIAIKTYGTE